MSFLPQKYDTTDLEYALIDNSQTISIGEAIIPGVQGDTSVILTAGGTLGPVLGVVLGFKDTAGSALEKSSVAAASDNVTVAEIKAAYLPAYKDVRYISDLDAAAETTDNSSAFGNFSIDSTGLLVDESTVQAFSVLENMQLFSFGLTGKDTTQVSVRFISTILGYNIA